MSVFEKEPEELPRRVGSVWIGVGAGTAAARPGMSGAVDDPVLEDRLPSRVGVKRAAVGMPAGYPTVLHGFTQVRHRGCPGLRDDLMAVARMNRAVLIPMKHDGRDHSPVFSGSAHGYGLALAHGGESGGEIAGGQHHATEASRLMLALSRPA